MFEPANISATDSNSNNLEPDFRSNSSPNNPDLSNRRQVEPKKTSTSSQVTQVTPEIASRLAGRTIGQKIWYLA